MKTLTCKELGGKCDQKISADTRNELVKNVSKHVIEEQPDLAKDMERMHNEDPQKWGRDMKPKFDTAPEQKTAVLTNTSDRDMTVARSRGSIQAEEAGYIVEVHDAAGNSVPDTKLDRVVEGAEEPTVGPLWSHSVVDLASGKSVENGMTLNKFYDLSASGKYQIEIHVTDPATKIVVKSNTVVVAVTA